MEISLDLNQPAGAILEQQARQLQQHVPLLTMEQAREYARKTLAWLACPEAGRRVEPVACMFCSCGHMTECHYPKDCASARCSHHLAAERVREATLK